MKSLTFFLLVGCIMLVACKKEENCPELVELGQLSLLETSNANFPYHKDIKRLVFKQSDGKEFYYSMHDFANDFELEAYGSKCEENENVTIRNEIRLEHLLAVFADTTNNHVLRTEMEVDLFFPFPADKMAADMVIVSEGNFLHSSSSYYTASSVLTITVDNRNYPTIHEESFDRFQESAVILGKVYKDVYTYSDEVSPGVKKLYYYNHAQGIIGFTDDNGQNLKVLDRVE